MALTKHLRKPIKFDLFKLLKVYDDEIYVDLPGTRLLSTSVSCLTNKRSFPLSLLKCSCDQCSDHKQAPHLHFYREVE